MTTDGGARRPAWRADLVLFALVFGTCAYFYNGYGWNQTARYDPIWAFVEPGPSRGTVRIDDFLTDPERGENTGDWARNPQHDEHWYSNKAPGTTLLGIPFYLALFHGEQALGFDPVSIPGVLVNAWLIHLWVTVLPVALSALFFRRLMLRLTGRHGRAFGLTLLLYLGTLMLPFSTMMWGHTTAAAFVVMAVTSFFLGGAGGAIASGALVGAAVLTDYGAAPVAVSLVALAAAWPERRRDALRVMAGGAAPFLVFVAYHAAVFGSPFRLASAYSQPSMIDEGGLQGLFGGLRAGALWGLTFARTRGLFFFMPVLLLALAGLRGVRGHRHERFAWFALANALVALVINLTFNGWHGGISAGARYQIVALPFWVSLLALLPDERRLRGALALLGAVSLANMFVIAAVSPLAPDALRGSPLLFAWAKLSGVVRVDLGLAAPVEPGGPLSRGSLHIYPVLLMRDWAIGLQDPLVARYACFNVGELLLGLRGSVSLLPVLGWAGGLSWVGLRSADAEDRAGAQG